MCFSRVHAIGFLLILSQQPDKFFEHLASLTYLSYSYDFWGFILSIISKVNTHVVFGIESSLSLLLAIASLVRSFILSAMATVPCDFVYFE